MTATLRERAEHAAKYSSNLMVPARDIKQLLDQLDQAEARIQAARDVLDRADARFDHAVLFNGANLPALASVADIRRALDGDPQ